jgi:hypothetical protein
MKLGVGEVSPDEAQSVEAIQKPLNRDAGGKAIRASEVAVLDQRHDGGVGSCDVIVRSDRGQLT